MSGIRDELAAALKAVLTIVEKQIDGGDLVMVRGDRTFFAVKKARRALALHRDDPERGTETTDD